MKTEFKRVPFLRATPDEIERQVLLVKSATSAFGIVEAQYKLFKMVWKLPCNKAKRGLVKSYIWPNIREWRKGYQDSIQNLRCYVKTMENTFKHLSTGQNNA